MQFPEFYSRRASIDSTHSITPDARFRWANGPFMEISPPRPADSTSSGCLATPTLVGSQRVVPPAGCGGTRGHGFVDLNRRARRVSLRSVALHFQDCDYWYIAPAPAMRDQILLKPQNRPNSVPICSTMTRHGPGYRRVIDELHLVASLQVVE